MPLRPDAAFLSARFYMKTKQFMPQGANIAVSIFSVGIFMAHPPCQLIVFFILPQFRELGNRQFFGRISYLSDIRDGQSKKYTLEIVHRWTAP